MKQFEVYEVLENADNIEGRGPMIHVAYFTNASDAIAAARGRGVMGGDGEAIPKTVTIFESYDEYTKVVADGIRKSALAKLTYSEKIALGLIGL